MWWMTNVQHLALKSSCNWLLHSFQYNDITWQHKRRKQTQPPKWKGHQASWRKTADFCSFTQSQIKYVSTPDISLAPALHCPVLRLIVLWVAVTVSSHAGNTAGRCLSVISAARWLEPCKRLLAASNLSRPSEGGVAQEEETQH